MDEEGLPLRKNFLLTEMDNVNLMMEGQGKAYVAIMGASGLSGLLILLFVLLFVFFFFLFFWWWWLLLSLFGCLRLFEVVFVEVGVSGSERKIFFWGNVVIFDLDGSGWGSKRR